jgi:hypothetical protein
MIENKELTPGNEPGTNPVRTHLAPAPSSASGNPWSRAWWKYRLHLRISRAASRFPFMTPCTITRSATSSYATNRTPPSPRRGTPRHRQDRRLLRHLRTRRHQPDHRPRRRSDGFHPDRRPHRPGFHQTHRQRRLPGSRHVRHHALLHQAQLPGQEPRRPPADHPRSLLPRRLRPPRSRAGGHPQGHLPGPGPTTARSTPSTCPATRSTPKATPARSAAPRR